jgi:hypothetical protein
MSLRAFVDSGGTEWRVFDVVPRTDERRMAERRVPVGAERAAKERREYDRRLSVGDLARLSTITKGWLCFDAEADCRRLTPIPRDWRGCSESTLEDYCRRARPVRQLRREVGHH